MRRLALFVCLLLGAGCATWLAAADGAVDLKLPRSVLTALPAIGTVYWRAECGPGERWALGLTAFRVSATDRVEYVAGDRRSQRVLQPSGTVWFPFSASTLQTIRVRQHTEPGVLRATVIVDFGIPKPGRAVVPHCYAYAPPRVTVQVYPR
jgi:hypothetical protein